MAVRRSDRENKTKHGGFSNVETKLFDIVPGGGAGGLQWASYTYIAAHFNPYIHPIGIYRHTSASGYGHFYLVAHAPGNGYAFSDPFGHANRGSQGIWPE